MAVPTDTLENLDKAVERLSFAEPLEDIRDLLVDETEKNFAAEMSPDGVKWEPLRPATRRKKRKNRDRILREQEQLVGSLKEPAGVEHLSANALEWGTDVKHATFHMTGTGAYKGQTTYGGKKNAKGMVKREFMGVTDPMADKMADIVADFVEKKIIDAFT